MEHRDADANGLRLLVDYSGNELQDTGEKAGRHAVVRNAKQEKELATLSQETRLMRAMNEIRDYSPKNMAPSERAAFAIMVGNILAKYGITDEVYRQWFGHLGTADQLHR